MMYVCVAVAGCVSQAWQSEVLDSEFLVDLVDSRTEGPRFKTFVSYSLVSTLCPTGVRRRYSDFEWLREILKMRFHGAFGCHVPCLFGFPWVAGTPWLFLLSFWG